MYDYFGRSACSTDDLNDDGVADLVVGAYGDDDGGTGAGAYWYMCYRTRV